MKAELAALTAEMLAWVGQQREKYRASSEVLTEERKASLANFFSPQILDQLRIRDVSNAEERIPYPPFYERVRAGGARVVPNAAHMTAIPFVDVALFNRKPTLRTIFHTLVHVSQFAIVGLERVIKGYFETLNESGLWMVVPYEEQAYQLDARNTRDPADVFSVEEEVRNGCARVAFLEAPPPATVNAPCGSDNEILAQWVAADSRRTITPDGASW